jgi:predicted PurR-regulated permease PerM
VLLGIGFAIFGVGSPVFWGFVGAISSLVPILGTSVIVMPAVIFLLIQGSIYQSIGLFLWGAVCVGLIDNVLSFLFLKDKIRIHPLIILFSILGGVEFFGSIGFLLGPIIISALISIMKIYPFIMSNKMINETQ